MKYYRIIFSPTGGTEKVANAITKNWKQIETIDLTLLDTDYAKISFEKDSLVLIAMPSFGGVAPSLFVHLPAGTQDIHSKSAQMPVFCQNILLSGTSA